MKKNKNIKRKKRLEKKRKRQQTFSQNKSKTNEVECLFSIAESSCYMFENEGPELIRSDYWETNDAKKGFFFLSINAGAFRLLVPQNKEEFIEEFRTGEYCIISKGASKMSNHLFMIELVFEDHSVAPFQLTLSPGQIDRSPSNTDSGHKFKLSVWTKGCKKVLEMDAYYRTVDSIPCLKPLGKQFKDIG